MKFNPKLRLSAEINIRSSVGYAVLMHMEQTLGAYPFKNCLNCTNFNEGMEQCSIWKARPPARVIAYGCDKHNDIDNIPF